MRARERETMRGGEREIKKEGKKEGEIERERDNDGVAVDGSSNWTQSFNDKLFKAISLKLM